MVNKCQGAILSKCKEASHSIPLSHWRKKQNQPSNTIRLGKVWKWYFGDIDVYMHLLFDMPPLCRHCSLKTLFFSVITVLLLEVFGLNSKHDPALNLVLLSSNLSQPCIHQFPLWGPDDQKAKEKGSRGRKDSGGEDSRPTTKIGQFSGQSWVSGRQSTWGHLYRRDECHS